MNYLGTGVRLLSGAIGCTLAGPIGLFVGSSVSEVISAELKKVLEKEWAAGESVLANLFSAQLDRRFARAPLSEPFRNAVQNALRLALRDLPPRLSPHERERTQQWFLAWDEQLQRTVLFQAADLQELRDAFRQPSGPTPPDIEAAYWRTLSALLERLAFEHGQAAATQPKIFEASGSGPRLADDVRFHEFLLTNLPEALEGRLSTILANDEFKGAWNALERLMLEDIEGRLEAIGSSVFRTEKRVEDLYKLVTEALTGMNSAERGDLFTLAREHPETIQSLYHELSREQATVRRLEAKTEELTRALTQWVERYRDLEMQLAEESDEPLLAEAREHLEHGRLAQAEQCLTGVLLKRQSRLAHTHYARAQVRALRRMVESAKEDYGAAVSLAPENATYRHGYARFLEDEGFLTAALEQAEELLRIHQAQSNPDPEEVSWALSYVGRLEAEKGEYRKAYETGAKLMRVLSSREPLRTYRDLRNAAACWNHLGVCCSELGMFDEGKLHYGRALLFRRRIVAEAGGDDSRHGLAITLSNLANLHSADGDFAAASDFSAEAVATHEELARHGGEEFQVELAKSLVNHASILTELEKLNEALALAQRAEMLFRAVPSPKPAVRSALARTLWIIAGARLRSGEPRAALPILEEAIATLRPLAAQDPVYRTNLASALSQQGGALLDSGRFPAAVSALEESRDIRVGLAEKDANVHAASLARVYSKLAAVEQKMGADVKAIKDYSEAVRLRRTAISLQDVSDHLMTLQRLAQLQLEKNNLEKAHEAIREALETLERRPIPDAVKLAIVQTSELVGIALRRAGSLQDAEAVLVSAAGYASSLDSRPEHALMRATTLSNLGNVYIDQRRFEAALRRLSEASTACQNLGNVQRFDVRPVLATISQNRGAAYVNLQQPQKAVAELEQALALRRSLFKDAPKAYAEPLRRTLNNLILAHQSLGNNEAAAMYEREEKRLSQD